MPSYLSSPQVQHTSNSPIRTHRISFKDHNQSRSGVSKQPRVSLTIKIPELIDSSQYPKPIHVCTPTSTPTAHTPSHRHQNAISLPKSARLEFISGWVESARARARNTSRDERAKLVAARLLAMHSPRRAARFPPPGLPRPYVRSRLSSMIIMDA